MPTRKITQPMYVYINEKKITQIDQRTAAFDFKM